MILGNNFLKNSLTALGYIFGISKTLFLLFLPSVKPMIFKTNKKKGKTKRSKIVRGTGYWLFYYYCLADFLTMIMLIELLSLLTERRAYSTTQSNAWVGCNTDLVAQAG